MSPFQRPLYWTRYAKPGDVLPALKVNPLRTGRAEPRCRKRRPKQYDLMNKPLEQFRAALSEGETVRKTREKSLS
jgi:hypothetical protein